MASLGGRITRVIPAKFFENLGSVKVGLRIPFPERLKGTVVEKWGKVTWV